MQDVDGAGDRTVLTRHGDAVRTMGLRQHDNIMMTSLEKLTLQERGALRCRLQESWAAKAVYLSN